MSKAFIIEVKYGGLGDHLFYSHLPRIAKQAGGYDFVFISTRSQFRNDSYRKLVWEMNPFVDGFFDGGADYPEFECIPDGMNLLDFIMLKRGLDDGERFHEPEVYYKPNQLDEFAKKTIYDPNFVSYVGEINARCLNTYLESIGGAQIQLKPRERSFALPGSMANLETSSLFHYCDLIHSCKQFVCLTSGGATLAAALKTPCTALYGKGQKPMFHHSKLHTYINASTDDKPASKITPEIEPEVRNCLQALKAHMDMGNIRTALDLGSRDGHVAILLQSALPAAQVFAFECNPDCISKCRTNLKLHPKISLVEMAVMDRPGIIDFFSIDPELTVTPHADGNIGASSIHPARQDYPLEKYVQKRIQVPAIALGDWAKEQQLSGIDFIWMDLQGAELLALKGLGPLIRKVKAIHTEVQYRRIYQNQPLASDINQFLTSHGFALVATLHQDAWMGNLLYVNQTDQVI